MAAPRYSRTAQESCLEDKGLFLSVNSADHGVSERHALVHKPMSDLVQRIGCSRNFSFVDADPLLLIALNQRFVVRRENRSTLGKRAQALLNFGSAPCNLFARGVRPFGHTVLRSLTKSAG